MHLEIKQNLRLDLKCDLLLMFVDLASFKMLLKITTYSDGMRLRRQFLVKQLSGY